MHALVTLVAKYFIIVPFLCALYVWLRLDRRDRLRFILVGLVTGVVAILLAKIGNQLYYDPRPFVAHHTVPYFHHGNDNGFPSDHTLLSATLAFVTLRFDRRWGALALLAALMVGAARVIAGVHHLADIAGSFIFAGIGVLAAIAVDNYVSRRTAGRPADGPRTE